MTIGQIIIALVPNHPSKDDVQAILYACYLLLSCVKRREPIFVCYSDVWNDMKGTDAYYLYQERKNDRGGWVVATIIAQGPGYATTVPGTFYIPEERY